MIPTATYRLQFRNGMTFGRSTVLVPYLKQLGISHLYASPVFTATSGSTHGYDITDFNEIDPALGGLEGFDCLAHTPKEHGLGLILDIVPNHMASSLENTWWRDVLEHGKNSCFARHFDIDWTRRLTFPFLGDTFEKLLENDEIGIRADPQTGRPAFFYADNFYPLTPDSYRGREATILNLNDKKAITNLHKLQPYRLTEAPEMWAVCIGQCRQMNQTKVIFLNDGTAPRGVDTWMLYQALAGVWPATLDLDDETALHALEARFVELSKKH